MTYDDWDDRIGFADGEWITWSDVARAEKDAFYAAGDRNAVPYFEQLLMLACDYHEETGGHLNVYGEIGELFGVEVYGIRRHRMYAQGSDGRLGADFVEIKTITPFKGHDRVQIRRSGNFNKVLVVRINDAFEVSGRLVARSDLKRGSGKMIRLNWSDIANLPHEAKGPVDPLSGLYSP